MKWVSMILVAFLSVGVLTAETAYASDLGDFLEIIGKVVGEKDPQPNRYGRGGRAIGGALSCVAQDDGWEEHSRSHDSCRSCLRQHGECVEVCSSSTVSCIVSANNRRGRVQEIEATGRDLWEAKNKAMRRCQRQGFRHCELESCDENKHIVSRTRC